MSQLCSDICDDDFCVLSNPIDNALVFLNNLLDSLHGSFLALLFGNLGFRLGCEVHVESYGAHDKVKHRYYYNSPYGKIKRVKWQSQNEQTG